MPRLSVVFGGCALLLVLASCTELLGGGDGGTADMGGRPDLAGVDLGNCPAGQFDLDGNMANGCEYACSLLSLTDAPDSAYVDANCDGIDGDVAHAIFVSTAGSDMNAGTMQMPVQTIGHALALARPHLYDVYVDQGTYTESLSLLDGAAVYGGFDRTASHAGAPAGFWDRRAGVTTRVMGGSIAVEASSVSMHAVLGWLTIVSADATDPGAPSIGVWAHDSTGVVTLDTVHVTSGAGGRGADGMAGHDGGLSGPGMGMTAGTSSCTHAGGTGGPAAGDGMDSPDGTPHGPGGANGGSCPSSGTNGMPGTDGAPGMAGMNGAAGDPAGMLTAGGAWAPIAGADGMDGTDGNGGGGGGGGGSGVALVIGCTSLPPTLGGGGGGGGCGGTTGHGGGGGGASIGVLAAAASVQLTNSDVTSGQGGAGGGGGGGGAHSAGGAPGTGGAGASVGSWHAGTGGSGGRGGDGGDGGAGGGGAGGPSFAVAHGGIGMAMQASTALHPGAGGAGGVSAGNTGPLGAVESVHEF